MKKYLTFIFLILSSLLFIPNVKALATSQYTYDVTKATYTNNYTVTQLSLDGWQFNICNDSNYCKIIDVTNIVQSAYGTFTLGDIDGINIVQGGNTADLYFEVYFKKYYSSSLTYYYSDYYEPRQYRLYMSTSYSDRRIVSATSNLKNGMTAPTGSNYLNMQWRYVYNFASNSLNTVTAPSSSTSNFIQTNQTLIKINYSSYNIYNTNDGYSINSTLYYSNNWVSPLPSYLTGYKKVVLDTDTKYVYLSNLSKGRIYILKNDFNKYGGKLSYWDLDKDYMNNDSIILDYKETSDKKYIYQDFDLLKYESSDLVVFNKFLYLENIDYDDFEYSIYVPESMFISKTKPIPNSSGGNDFPAEYQNANGEIISFTPKSEDLSMSDVEKTLYQISYNLKDNNLLAYFTDTWENLKLSKIYSYILLSITGGIIIFLFKVMNK